MPPAMGQPITVVEKPSSTPGIVRFETNRSLTGMGHERYASVDDILDDRPVDELARRLFDSGGVTEVHVNGSVVTVHLAEGWTGEKLLDVIRGPVHLLPAGRDGDAVGGRSRQPRRESLTAPRPSPTSPPSRRASDATGQAPGRL